MRKFIPLLLAFVFPCLLFANAFQAFRFDALSREVALLERTQHEVIEENKRAIATLSVLKSPARIRTIARDQLELEQVEIGRIYTIMLGTGR